MKGQPLPPTTAACPLPRAPSGGAAVMVFKVILALSFN